MMEHPATETAMQSSDIPAATSTPSSHSSNLDTTNQSAASTPEVDSDAQPHLNIAWATLEEVPYARLAPGRSIVVFAPNVRSPAEVLPSERIIATRSTRRLPLDYAPLAHCAHYHYNRRCNRGSQCGFVHAVRLANAEPQLINIAPPVTPAGRGRRGGGNNLSTTRHGSIYPPVGGGGWVLCQPAPAPVRMEFGPQVMQHPSHLHQIGQQVVVLNAPPPHPNQLPGQATGPGPNAVYVMSNSAPGPAPQGGTLMQWFPAQVSPQVWCARFN
jgi:hypothetical protein